VILAMFFTTTNNLFGQIPVIETPKPASFTIITPGFNNPNPQTRQVNTNPITPNQPNPVDMYERSRREIQQRDAEILKMLREYSVLNQPIQYELPSWLGIYGTEYYQKAFEKLCSMLDGETPLNLKDAVFIVENAYLENKLYYPEYNRAINELAKLTEWKAIQDGYDWNNPVTRNVMLFRKMVDTLYIQVPQREITVTSYPMRYDFNDFMGKDNWTNMFVTKLMATKTGQCHSLPLLYLILCEATGAEAYLAHAPSHFYIKFKDESGYWYNLELTNGHIVTDAHIVGSGYITAEAIKNRTYMEPQTKHQVIAQCLADLALGYIEKYGNDSFVKQCTDAILKYDENNLTALMIYANYETERCKYLVTQVGRPHANTLKVQYPDIYELWQKLYKLYDRIDATGYREMPKEAYKAWLHYMNEEKERQAHQETNNKILQLIR